MFLLSWLVSSGAMLAFCAFVGSRVNGSQSYLGVLVDDRDRLSLNRLQIVMWTILVLSTLAALLVKNLVTSGALEPNTFEIPDSFLALMGIAAGGSALTGAVKANKDVTRETQIAMGEQAVQSRNMTEVLAIDNDTGKPHFMQLVLEEEGAGAEKIISIPKLQNLISTIAVGLMFAVATCSDEKFVNLGSQLPWLFGMSHAGYIGGKMQQKPDGKTTSAPSPPTQLQTPAAVQAE